MKRLLPLPLLLLLMGPTDCNPGIPPEPKGYCTGMEGTVNSAVNGVKGLWTAIIGGFPAENRYATVSVKILGVGSCTGTILSPHTVVTAGHCDGDNGYRVHLDATESYPGCATDTDGTAVSCWNATGWLQHPGYPRWSNYRGEPHDDVMLFYFDNVELPGPYPSGFYDDDTMSARCEKTFGQGWGQTARTDAPPPEGWERIPCPDGKAGCLQEGDIRVLEEGPTDIDTQLVSALNWGNICFGDSGGPLYALVTGYPGFYLAGITSTISAANCIGYGDNRAYSTHVKASAYKGWITANTR